MVARLSLRGCVVVALFCSACHSDTPAAGITVAVSPHTATLDAGTTQNFSAVVSGTAAGQSTAVTWSVQEGASGGSITADGVYTAPNTAGTFHVVGTSIADTSRNDTATVTVTQAIHVTVSPTAPTVAPSGTQAFTATVTGATGAQSTAVTWSVQEGAAGGTVDGTGHYTAPAAEGTYHVVATSVADTTKSATATVSVTSLAVLTADRRTVWNPGVVGGVPSRTTVCANIPAGASLTTIQNAVEACPAGQVVQLAAGTYTIANGTSDFLIIDKGVTVRGAGPGQTILQKLNGATANNENTGPHPGPLVILGPSQFSTNGTNTDTVASTNLTADAANGTSSVTVASASGFTAGMIVLLDELSGAAFRTDPGGRGQIFASSDFRVVWQLHSPAQETDDPFTLPACSTDQDAFSWFSRCNRPTGEVKEIDHVTGNTIFFTTPIHISYRTSHTAQLSRYGQVHVKTAGIENLTVTGGDNGNIRFQWCNQCWAKSVENTLWHDEGFAVDNSYRVEIRESFVHDAAWAQPGGAGYAISLSTASSEILVENSISIMANKVMVARCSGAGSVFGYNYVDDGYINNNGLWQEVGLNASHMVGPHHVLFEGNYGFNWDSDKTHGNSIYHTVFRNHLRGVRSTFTYFDTGLGHNVTVTDSATVCGGSGCAGPLRAGGATYYSYWHSFIGNVLGAPGQMAGWVYDDGALDQPSIWKLGWDDWNPYPIDPQVAATTVRDGNYDYVTNSVKWDAADTAHVLPASLYLSQKPAFFNAGHGYTWPWVDPLGADDAHRLYTLPAKARFDAGTPFTQP